MQNPSDLSVTTILALAQAKIRDPQHWCHGTLATDAAGYVVKYDDTLAEHWCAVGAVASVLGRQMVESRCDLPALERLDQAARLLTGVGTVTVNDFHGHAAIMRAFDLAVADIEL
jgi:hypothetical protein